MLAIDLSPLAGPAGYALVGVVVGALLNQLFQSRRDKKNDERGTEVLAVDYVERAGAACASNGAGHTMPPMMRPVRRSGAARVTASAAGHTGDLWSRSALADRKHRKLGFELATAAMRTLRFLRSVYQRFKTLVAVAADVFEDGHE